MSGVKDEFKHGMSSTPTYKSWEMMKQRCTNKKFDSYPHYGGKGVSFCQRWEDFKSFLEDMGERPEGMSLDRKDPNRGYTKDNCRWADSNTQAINKGLRKDNTTGTTGVYYHKGSGKWTASITWRGKTEYLGLHKDKQDAIVARSDKLSSILKDSGVVDMEEENGV